MAIPVEIETVLNTALADKPDVLTFVKGLDAKADKLTPEIEAALPKLATIPEMEKSVTALAKILAETKAENADKLIADFKNVTSVNADLIKQRTAWIAGGKGADSPEYKALEERITTLTTDFAAQIKTLTEESKANKDTAAAAVVSKRETDLKSSIVTAGAKHKIKDIEDEFVLLQAKGQVGHKEVDGKHVPFFYKLNEKGEKVDAGSADALMKHIADTFKHKVDPSGKGGPGADHRGAGGGGADSPASVADARKAFLKPT